MPAGINLSQEITFILHIYDQAGNEGVSNPKKINKPECLAPQPLSDIGTAMNTEISPAAGNCGSTFKELIIIDPTTDGTQAFQKFADLAKAANHEILLANMTWDAPIEGNDAAQIILNGIVDAYKRLVAK